MKREFLKNFKVGESELPKEVIDAILDENSRDIEATKTKFADYDEIKTQLEEANKSIESFKGMDIDGVKAAADEWKTKFEEAERTHAEKLAEMTFNGVLDTAISGAKGKNAKALRGLLDIEALKASSNQSDDIKAALDALKESDGYLFDTDTPPVYAGGTGGTPIGGGDPGINAIRAAAGLTD